MFSYQNLAGLEGNTNRPGVKKTVYLAPLRAFDVIGAVADPEAADNTRITVATDHTFQATEGFIKCYTTADTGQLLAESVGERDGRNHSVKLNFFHPGAKADALAFADAAQYDEYIILAETLEGDFIQLGEADLGADIMSNFDSGTLSSGRKGWSFTAEYFGSLKLYTGTVTVKPEV